MLVYLVAETFNNVRTIAFLHYVYFLHYSLIALRSGVCRDHFDCACLPSVLVNCLVDLPIRTRT